MRPSDPRRTALDYLIAACGRWLADPAGTEVQAAPPTGPSAATLDDAAVAALARLASLHNLEPLLYHLADRGRLAGHPPPSELLARWEAAYHHNAIFQAELFDHLARLLDGCARRGVRVAVFKGPVTAARGWGDPALRQMADLDLLIDPGDLAAGGAAAGEAGFRAAEQTSDYHLGFRHRRLPAGLELHFRLWDVVARPAELWTAIWDRLERVTIDGLELPAPAPAEAATLDVAHLVQHDLELNLRPLVDLAATTAPARVGGTGELSRRLADADLAPEFELIAALVVHRLGWPAPAGVAPPPPPEALARRLDQSLLAPERHLGDPSGGPHRKAGPGATVGYLLRQLLPPPSRLAALSGRADLATGLARWPGHARAALGRWLALRRAAAGRLKEPAVSIKEALHRRREKAG